MNPYKLPFFWRFVKQARLFTICLAFASLLACSDPGVSPETQTVNPLNLGNSGKSQEEITPVIYVSVVSHNEEPQPGGYVDFVKNEGAFWKHHEEILYFAEQLRDLGVTWNFQSEWNFLLATLQYDLGSEETNGKNLLRYLVEDLEMEVDPHAHESKYNYADLAYLLDQLGVPVSTIAGGFIADPPEKSKFESFLEPIHGLVYDYTWQAEALWGGGTGNHVNEDQLHISGIWYPSGNDAFLVNDPEGTLPEIGGYKSKEGFDAVHELLVLQETGELNSNQIYTVSIFFTQSKLLDEAFVEDFLNQVQELQPYVDEGRIEWVGLQEVLEIWKSQYGAEGTLFWGE